MKYQSVVALGISATVSSVAHANDKAVYAHPGQSVSLQAGVGYTWLEGNELVYDGQGNRISHLIWDTQAPVLTLGADAEVTDNWRIMAHGTFGFSGTGKSHGADYDWIVPLSPSYAFNDWSGRSLSPADLDRYIAVDIAAGRDFVIDDATKVNIQGGFKYTDVKWTDHGGSHVYRSAGFRDDVGTFANVPGITFEQRYPAIFLGAQAARTSGLWTFTGLLRGGVSVSPSDTDHHWLRDIRFEDRYDLAPFVSLGAQAGYKVAANTDFFVGGSYDRYFRTKGDMTPYDIPTGTQLGGPNVNSAGMDFYSLTLSAGLKMTF
ncbi:omptin family outer membrane protease [Mesorhizobium sp. M1A.F.Ca.ET.072.01.1.1]|uniref:omptin family outer membrane protease n=1 Tax=Mesorhizobium sp. M1A.F.Ca.ET.072.01.1.1 TaxID=2496753 RepID=UPI001FE05A3E|nr:omptin family outer membrane protease [Mesorhizobium sp. M1A.F.Ca.ET.072.01.1.1]